MVRFTVPMKVDATYGLNKIYSGIHWNQRKEIAEEVHGLVYYSMLGQKVKRIIFQKPVCISISYNSKLDCDNHGFLTKMLIDSLKGYLIQDDSKKYVQEVRQKFHDGADVIVEVWELGEQLITEQSMR